MRIAMTTVAGVRNLICCLALAAAAAMTTLGAAQTRSLAEIEAELDPLEFIENHDGVRRSMDLSIEFAFNSAELLPEGQHQVEILGRAMQGERLAPYRFRIIGHTDAVGSAEYNQQLSSQRAERVLQVLVEDYSVESQRLVAEGKGETELLGGLPEDAREHRRVEIAVLDDTAAEFEQTEKHDSDAIDW